MIKPVRGIQRRSSPGAWAGRAALCPQWVPGEGPTGKATFPSKDEMSYIEPLLPAKEVQEPQPEHFPGCLPLTVSISAPQLPALHSPLFY